MPHKIAILVRADVGLETIELGVSGCLTDTTQQILYRQIAKARNLDPAAPIEVDLTAVRHIEPAALQDLRSAVTSEMAGDVRVVDPVRFRLPELPQPCPWDDELGEVTS